MPSARDNRIERDTFYKQLGEQAKLNHTFVNPKTSSGMQTFVGSASRSAPPPGSAPLCPFPRHFEPSVALESRAFSIPSSQMTESSHLPLNIPPVQAPGSHSSFLAAQPPVASTWHHPASPQAPREWDQPQYAPHPPSNDLQSLVAAEVERLMTSRPLDNARERELEYICAKLQAQVEQYKQTADEEVAKCREAEEKASSAIKHQSFLGKAKAEADHKLAQAEKMLAEERDVTANLRRRVQDLESKVQREVEETKRRLHTTMNEKHNLNEKLSLVTAEKEKSLDKVKMIRFDKKALEQQNIELRNQLAAVQQRYDQSQHVIRELKNEIQSKEISKPLPVGTDLVSPLNYLPQPPSRTSSEKPFESDAPLPQLSEVQSANTASSTPAPRVGEGATARPGGDPYEGLASAFK